MHSAFLFPREFLGAPDLQGKEVTLTISKLKQEEIPTDRGPETKWVMHFVEMEARVKANPKALNRRMVLNRTAAKTITKLYGPETNDWVGKRITLYATQCKAFGEVVDCIRIRKHVPSAKVKGNLPPDAERNGEPELPRTAPNPDGPGPDDFPEPGADG